MKACGGQLTELAVAYTRDGEAFIVSECMECGDVQLFSEFVWLSMVEEDDDGKEVGGTCLVAGRAP